jgi:hypothetical protein
LLTTETHLLFADCICNLGSLAKEIKVLAYLLWGFPVLATKRIIVEDIVRLVELVSKSIVGVFEVQTLSIVLVLYT